MNPYNWLSSDVVRTSFSPQYDSVLLTIQRNKSYMNSVARFRFLDDKIFVNLEQEELQKTCSNVWKKIPKRLEVSLDEIDWTFNVAVTGYHSFISAKEVGGWISFSEERIRSIKRGLERLIERDCEDFLIDPVILVYACHHLLASKGLTSGI